MHLANCHVVAATLDILATTRYLNVLFVLETNTEIFKKRTKIHNDFKHYNNYKSTRNISK